MYTSQGMMTPADLTDFRVLYDLGPNPECPGHDDDPVGQYGERYYCSVNEECPYEDGVMP